jgi:hypothetical protein
VSKAEIIKVYLDDERIAPEGWHQVYWPDEAIELLRLNSVSEISLDHDLGDNFRGTGYEVILWVGEAVACNDFVPPVIKISFYKLFKSALYRGCE